MKAITLNGPTYDALQMVEMPDLGNPGPGRIIVKMRAASLNFVDVAVINGHYPGVPFPIIPVADGAGEVVAVGEGVWQVATGDRVITAPKPDWVAGRPTAEIAGRMRGATVPGSLVQYAEMNASSVVKAPEHLGWSELASLPVAAMTAWRALEAAAVGPASTVLALGTGGVSMFTLQFAKARGARVIITSASDEKLDRGRSLGADVGINYRANPDWQDAVLKATSGLGADFILDPVGGAQFAQTISAARHGGHISLIGFLGGGQAPLDLLPLIFNEVRVQGSNGGSVADLQGAVDVVASHSLRPLVDQSFPLADLAAAYRLMAAGGHIGKIAIEFDW